MVEIMIDALIGDELRKLRIQQRLTLRDVSSVAHVALGYLSEAERGQKQLSNVMLESICEALGVKQSKLLWNVATNLRKEGL
jgi:transcriptional regulator with XRE-family HTH domain